MITLKEFKKGKIAINTRTQEEYDNLMKFFDKNDMYFYNKNIKDHFNNEKTICFRYNGDFLQFSGKGYYEAHGYKIILPNQLKEYNEFIGNVKFTKDVGVGDLVFKGEDGKFHKAEPEYLNIGEAINYMLESEENVIEYIQAGDEEFKGRIRNGRLECYSCAYEEWDVDRNSNIEYLNKNWTKIKKYIEPVKHHKTDEEILKDRIKEKATFKYKNNWYRFNKDGAIIDSNGGAVGLDKITELLNKKEIK